MNYPKHDSELILDLWNACDNNCVFCYNQTLMHLPLDIKQHLYNCNTILNSCFIENFNRLRFLGGELFDDSMNKLGVNQDFMELMKSAAILLQNNQIMKLNLLTNLIYEDNKHLKETLAYFEKVGVIDKVEISTSYDIAGRFNKKDSEQWWWNNINWIRATYPEMKIDIGMILTQPLIETVTKEWIDTFLLKAKGCNINFSELDIALLKGKDKSNSPYRYLFPKRHDFLRFLKNLKDWGYASLVGVDPGGNTPWNRIYSMQYIHVGEFDFPIFKNLSFLLTEREDFKQDGYLDSDIPLYYDIKKMLDL